MVTSAKGAEEFYTVDDNAARSEGLEEARMRDTKAAEAWVGHPYVDVVDNSSDFEHKINVLIEKVSPAGLESHDIYTAQNVAILLGLTYIYGG